MKIKTVSFLAMVLSVSSLAFSSTSRAGDKTYPISISSVVLRALTATETKIQGRGYEGGKYLHRIAHVTGTIKYGLLRKGNVDEDASVQVIQDGKDWSSSGVSTIKIGVSALEAERNPQSLTVYASGFGGDTHWTRGPSNKVVELGQLNLKTGAFQPRAGVTFSATRFERRKNSFLDFGFIEYNKTTLTFTVK